MLQFSLKVKGKNLSCKKAFFPLNPFSKEFCAQKYKFTPTEGNRKKFSEAMLQILLNHKKSGHVPDFLFL
jgi:hypothetical protein